MDKIFETSSSFSSFRVKHRTTGKFFASIDKNFFFWEEDSALGNHSMKIWDFPDIL